LAREKFADLIGHIDEILGRIFMRHGRPPLCRGFIPNAVRAGKYFDDLAGKARFVLQMVFGWRWRLTSANITTYLRGVTPGRQRSANINVENR
jgi:hypothetical protein